MCGKVTLIGGLLILTGIISSGTLISVGVHIFNNFQNYKCGNLNYGILVGLASMVILITNMLLYGVTCVKKSSLIIPSICVLGSLIYNIYLVNQMGDICVSYYEYDNRTLWDYYIYYLLSLIVNIVFIITIIVYSCCKRNKQN